MSFNNATICLNGHVISEDESNFLEFCTICGSQTYSSCSKCKSPILGSETFEYVPKSYTKPNYCHKCGEPYPWTQLILDNAVELLALDEELDEDTKTLIKTAIPNLLVETPSTPLAVARYKKGIANASQIVRDSMHNLLVDVLSETAKKILSP